VFDESDGINVFNRVVHRWRLAVDPDGPVLEALRLI